MVGSPRSLMLVGTLLGVLACSKKPAEPTAAPPAAAPTPSPVPAAAAKAAEDTNKTGEGKLDPNDPRHGTRKLMGLDAPVYVDGTQAAVLRYGEMPTMTPILREGGAKRFRISDYLTGIGVNLDAVKSVHFHGNNDRIASLEGSELRKEKDRFVFGYPSVGDTGTPHMKWDTGGLKNEFTVHEIRRVSIFVKKQPAPIHKDKQCHVGADGDCTDAIPYADGVVAKGTRIYLDGKMVGFVKRRQVTDDMRVSASAADPSETKFSFAKLLASMGVSPTTVKSIEFVAGDDVVARAGGEQFVTLAPQTHFTLPKHNHGKVRVHVPAEMQVKAPGITDRDALVSSVLLYRDTVSSNRDLVAISEDTDLSVQLAAIDDARGRLGRGEQ